MTNSLFHKLTFKQNPKLWDNLQHIKPVLTPDTTVLYKDNWLKINHCIDDDDLKEYARTEWLIRLFNQLFVQHNTVLMRACSQKKIDEPEYFPATADQPAKILFAHGFFASALHEISHWCIAGKHRRTLNDFGYWYAADGRNEAQQAKFEQAEIKPQAIECLLTLACGLNFQVSQDNLFADFDTSNSTFKSDVYQQACQYLNKPDTLPKDATVLVSMLLKLCQ